MQKKKMLMRRGLKFALISGIISFALGASAVFIVVIVIAQNLPSPTEIGAHRIAQSSKIYDRTGEVLLYELSGEEKRTVVPFEKIPDSMKYATLAAEDKNFYTHPAFDWKALARALLKNAAKGSFFTCEGGCQGGSTITQQLAKSMFFSPERTYTRKIKELFVAIQLEEKYSKDEILGMYLNQIPYGSNAYGVEAASMTYFGKHIEELSLAETVSIASMAKAPTYYSPWGTHLQELDARRMAVLAQMKELGFISDTERDAAKSEKIKYQPQGNSMKAPHFVMAVQDYLNEKYGEEYVRSGGLRIVTTLDWNLQTLAEKAVREGAERNEELYKGANAALFAEDAKTGQVLALVGSKDYFGDPIPAHCTPGKNCRFEGNFNVATQGLRQPGSSFKPFVYLEAFARGYTPDTVVFDLPTEFSTYREECPMTNINYLKEEKKCFHPHNFDGKFIGPVSLRSALAQSINIPAVKTLYLVGTDHVLNLSSSLGITTLTDKSRYGLSLVLGGGEIKLSELVGAYSAFAQEGMFRSQSFILSVHDIHGTALEEYQDRARQVIDPQPVRLLNDVLSDTEARAPLFSASLELTKIPNQEVALKTGTTNDYRDAWVVGYNPSFVVGVWAGNNDNTPMQKKGGSILAAVPIWSAFAQEAFKTIPTEAFTKPEVVKPEKPILQGNFLSNFEIHNILHYVDRNDPTGPVPENPQNDFQYENWEVPVQEWAKKNLENYFIYYNKGGAPTSTPSHTPLSFGAPKIIILSPQQGQFASQGIDFRTTIQGQFPISKITLLLNDSVIDKKSGPYNTPITYTNTIAPEKLYLQNLLTIRVTDVMGNSSESSLIVYK